MLELKYDILDDLEARESNAAQQVADEEEHLLPPKEWYDECRRSGSNAVFMISFSYRIFHQNGSYNFDIHKFVEAYNSIKDRYFKNMPDVQVVHPENNYNDMPLPEWIQTERFSDSKKFLGVSELNGDMNTDNCVIFKIPVKIDLIRYPMIELLAKEMITINNDKQLFYKNTERSLNKIANFLSSICAFHQHNKISRKMYFYTATDDEWMGGYITLLSIKYTLYDIKYKKENDNRGEDDTINKLVYLINCGHQQTSDVDYPLVRRLYHKWVARQLNRE